MLKPIEEIPSLENELSSLDFKKMHDKYRIDINAKLKPEPIALSLGEYKYKNNYYPTPFGTYGNFSCLVGPSKSYKTFLKSAIIASYIGGKSNFYFPSLKGHDTKSKFVIDVDTEQSTFHTQKVAKRVCEMVGSNYDLFVPFGLREEDSKNRFKFIEWIMLESEYRNDIGLITIDGAADILETVNDLDVSNKIVQSMMKWTSVSNAHLCTILHKNHGTDKPTGHLGSAIMKKAETVAFVERDDDEVTVTSNFTRNIPFDVLRFKINENFLPKESEESY
ncbi:hypothetical protein [Mariniflexile sp. HMF6888]|uniref:hypothetical protein n=1 Tax=Mariniflexile sp. HMF6888 TaxID=3373086 RepID=UPI0037A91488